MVVNVEEVARSTTAETGPGHRLAERYARVRQLSVELCEPLVTEDYVVQSMPNVSPTKWHLAHMTWFFETFVLDEHRTGYTTPNPEFAYLFNSYYNAVGDQFSRPDRGLITRPAVADVYDYREHVDRHMLALLREADETRLATLEPLVTIGLQHEQQHQELMLTDIKHVFSVNPLHPAYQDRVRTDGTAPPRGWIAFAEGVHEIGYAGDGFSFDNERPRHKVYLQPFELATRPVTNGEYLAFMADEGYERHELWLSEGWSTVQAEGWRAPLYWLERDGEWHHFTLSGLQPVDPEAPVCHISLYEADAYARWAGARLPTEAEWEVAAETVPIDGNFVGSGRLHPEAAATPTGNGRTGGGPSDTLAQMFGDVWEWTGSQYTPYPGFKAAPGALGEYNGKFMCNQHVLRGGSCATSRDHIRRTYRNFFPAGARWQFTGLRLARDA